MQCHVPSDCSLDLAAVSRGIPSDHTYRFLIHDRESIFSAEVDDELVAFGLKVLRTPVQAPKANAYCERLMGTIRRECLDYVIPLSEKHLRTILREWVTHYNPLQSRTTQCELGTSYSGFRQQAAAVPKHPSP